MRKSIELSLDTRNSYAVVIGISVVIVVLTGILYARNASIFRSLLGRVPPLVAVPAVACLGIVLVGCLMSRGWFVVIGQGTGRGVLWACGLAALLGAIIILVDLRGAFTAEISRPLPDSLFYYPVFGYVAEVVFHLLPLTLLLLGLTRLFGAGSFEKVVWPAIVFVAALEPVFQTALPGARPRPTWAVVYVFFHILAINLLQLALFKRHDLVSMWAFRLVYYGIWHVAWGSVRLGVLF